MQFKFVINLTSVCFAAVEPWQIPHMPYFLKWKLYINFSDSLQKPSVFSSTQFLSPEGSASPLAFNKCALCDHWQNLCLAFFFFQMSSFQNKCIIKAQSCVYLLKPICQSSTSLTWKSQITFLFHPKVSIHQEFAFPYFGLMCPCFPSNTVIHFIPVILGSSGPSKRFFPQ